MAKEDIGSLVVRIEANLKDFNNGINNVNKKVDGMGKGLKNLGKIIAGAFVVKAVVGFGKEVAKSAMEQERAENRLNTLMKNVNGTTDEQIESLKALARAQQNLTTIGDEVTMAGQSQLATFQLSADNIAKLTPAFQDLAVATYGANVSQEQMIQSGNLIGKVMQGQVGALSRVGVSFTEAQEKILKTGTEAEKTAALIEVLGSNFGGLAKTTRSTTEGAIIAMNNAWGDMKEVLGDFLLPILGKAATWFSSKIPQIRATMVGAFEKINPIVMKLYEIFNQEVLPILKEVYSWIQSNMPTVKATIKGVFDAIIPLIERVWRIIKENLIPTFQTLYNWVEPYFPLMGEIIEASFGRIIDRLNFAIDVFEAVTSAIKDVVTWIDKFNNKEIKEKSVDVSASTSSYYGRAIGGPVSKGSTYLVGEKGKELFTPSQNGTIIPNNQTERLLNQSNNYENMVTGNTFIVRSDTDIQAIAREIYNLTQSKNRGSGVVPA